ncbi:hypothetical protein C0J52_09904 [Blattella germanica]|nr:hypothetical protein C0J52_09904 [Blattella germanica]
MVHKKSEYRLQFHLLEKDLRKKIWQDNIKFRESRRVINQADHYWTYQLTDEQCECDDEEEGEEEEDDDETTLPQHNSLKVLQTETEDVPKQHSSRLEQEQEKTLALATHGQEAQNIAIQTPDWEFPKLSERGATISEIRPESVKKHEQHSKSEENVAPLPISTHHNSKAYQLQSQPHRVHFKNNTSVGQSTERSICSSSRTTCPTKTARKTYLEERKSPFASFGWNDSNRDIGQKKTYNGHVNHSSIWMSEYQEKFSHGKKYVQDCFHRRPVSAPPSHRSCGWRYS